MTKCDYNYNMSKDDTVEYIPLFNPPLLKNVVGLIGVKNDIYHPVDKFFGQDTQDFFGSVVESFAKKGKHPQEIADCETVVRLLNNPDLMHRQLKKLNDELAVRARQAGRYDLKKPEQGLTDKGWLPHYHAPFPEYHKHNKLLSGFFEDWANQNGFAGVVNLTQFETPEQFNKHLRTGLLPLKDRPFQGTNHTGYAHMIQWYCWVEALKETCLSMHKSPVEMLQWFGDGNEYSWLYIFEDGRGMGNVFSVLARIQEMNARDASVLQQLVGGREQKHRQVIESKQFIIEKKQEMPQQADTGAGTQVKLRTLGLS